MPGTRKAAGLTVFLRGGARVFVFHLLGLLSFGPVGFMRRGLPRSEKADHLSSKTHPSLEGQLSHAAAFHTLTRSLFCNPGLLKGGVAGQRVGF